jgi:hypothetical protein
MIHAKFVNPGKCSKIKNVAPDPGSCTREKTFVAARQGSDFFVIRSSAGQTPQADGQ